MGCNQAKPVNTEDLEVEIRANIIKEFEPQIEDLKAQVSAAQAGDGGAAQIANLEGKLASKDAELAKSAAQISSLQNELQQLKAQE